VRASLTTITTLALAAIATGCGGSTGKTDDIYAAVGATKIAQTSSYIVVMNIVPPEEMYQPAEAATKKPSEGEFILQGLMAPIHGDSRHFEAHIYSQTTGKPLEGLHPVVSVVDHTTGTTFPIVMTLMQDVIVGPPDLHYGNNADMPAGHDYTVNVTIGPEHTAFDLKLV
jgi:hypothetical protein